MENLLKKTIISLTMTLICNTVFAVSWQSEHKAEPQHYSRGNCPEINNLKFPAGSSADYLLN